MPERKVRRFAEYVNLGIGHPLAFVLASVQTLLWTILVLATSFDPHGFWFLYFATAVSYVTQFTLTLVGLSAKREARLAADEGARSIRLLQQSLENQHASLGALDALLKSRALLFDDMRQAIDLLLRGQDEQDAVLELLKQHDHWERHGGKLRR